MSAAEPLTEARIATVARLIAAAEGPCSCKVDDGDAIETCPRCEAWDVLPSWCGGLLATIRARDEEIVEQAERAKLYRARWVAVLEALRLPPGDRDAIGAIAARDEEIARLRDVLASMCANDPCLP